MAVPIVEPSQLESYTQVEFDWLDSDTNDYLVFWILPEDDRDEVPIYVGSSKNTTGSQRSQEFKIEPIMPGLPLKDIHRGVLKVVQEG